MNLLYFFILYMLIGYIRMFIYIYYATDPNGKLLKPSNISGILLPATLGALMWPLNMLFLDG